MQKKVIFLLTKRPLAFNLHFLLSGNNSVVECDLAKVEVASSNLVSRSIFFGGIAKW